MNLLPALLLGGLLLLALPLLFAGDVLTEYGSMRGKGDGEKRQSLIVFLLGLTLYFSGHGGSDTGTNYQVNIEMLMMEKNENSINYRVNIEHVIIIVIPVS